MEDLGEKKGTQAGGARRLDLCRKGEGDGVVSPCPDLRQTRTWAEFSGLGGGQAGKGDT